MIRATKPFIPGLPRTITSGRNLPVGVKMADKTIFKRIIDGEIPTDLIHEDDHCVAFHDIAPQAPVHFLVVPKKEIRSVADLTADDAAIVGHLFLVIRQLAEKLVPDSGYRVITNCGADAGQTVFHLHFHVLAGHKMAWP